MTGNEVPSEKASWICSGWGWRLLRIESWEDKESLWRTKFPRDTVSFHQKTGKQTGAQEPGARREGAVEIQEESQHL